MSIPDDILHMVCTQLCHQRDFNTLFSCACSGKRLATLALASLYRMHDVALATDTDCDEDSDEHSNEDSDEEIPAHDKLGRKDHGRKLSKKERIFMKWAGLWRTIILSSLGKTLYPYSQYIRTLNLQNLEKLLKDYKFRAKDFFKGDLAQFKVDKVAPIWRHRQLITMKTIYMIGDAITMQTPMLEVLTGKVSSKALSRWIPRLPRLTHLKPWHGTAFKGNGNLIRLHCPSFKGVHFQDWGSGNSQQVLAAFLNELRPQSIESFEISNDEQSYDSFESDSSQVSLEWFETISDQQPLKSSETNGDEQPPKSSEANSDQQPLESSETNGDEQPPKSSEANSDQQPLESSETNGDEQPLKSSGTNSDQQPLESSETNGDEQPLKSSGTNSDDQQSLESFEMDSDQEPLESFEADSYQQSLESFEADSYPTLGTEMFQALSCHNESLTELKLNMLWSVTVDDISLLKGCTDLVSLSLDGGNNDPYSSNRKNPHKDTFLEMVAWVKECKKLRSLSIIQLFNSLAWMSPILLQNGIHLTSLEFDVSAYKGFEMRDVEKFHQALTNQTSLRRLWLRGSVDDYKLEADVLVQSLCMLVNLTDLRMGQICDSLVDRHIVQLASSLSKLEIWMTGGEGLTDDIWDEVGSLSSLRILTFDGSTSFTGPGIYDFIDQLGPGNKGLGLSVLNAARDSDITRIDRQSIEEIIAEKFKGWFEFQWGLE